jgi:hypothetical protein
MRELAGYRSDKQLDKPNAVALLEVQQMLRNRRRYCRRRTAKRMKAAARGCFLWNIWTKQQILERKRERRRRKKKGSRPGRKR